jgi:glyoxylase-like metal-dependent hydrolase (beta-lactamase superfamily II)
MDVMQKIQSTAESRTIDRSNTVAPDLAYLRTGIVNLCFYGRPGAPNGEWVLIDAGIPGYASRIMRAAQEWIGPWARPAAILLTHGHFDHVGSLRTLAERWDVPVYAHRLELPYLTGRSSYPPPDPTVGGGAMAALSRFYPRGPINLGGRVQVLPEDGSVPGMPGWRWIHTPGHTAGHVAFFREEDRTLIAGDAFVTTKQESALAVLTQRPELHGPPAYYTPDWESARRSVERLAALEPLRIITGHGPPLQGQQMLAGLHRLARNFDRMAVPAMGRYVGRPALSDERGVIAVPPPPADPWPGIALAIGLGLLVAAAVKRSARQPELVAGEHVG